MNKLKQFWISFLTVAPLVSLCSNAQAQWYTPIPPPDISGYAIDLEICRQNPDLRNHPRCQNPGSLGIGNQKPNTDAPNSTINHQVASAYLK